ncbi:MAG: ypeA [Firmicutes bacterium]|nr:ypeA [Bacillota bacterium]
MNEKTSFMAGGVALDSCTVRAMRLDDYLVVIDFWKQTPGLRLSEADSKENMDLFLQRNDGFSFVAEAAGQLVGTILCGHDGRRGFLYHLAVHGGYRKKGLGRQLVRRCLAKLAANGIGKCHLFVMEGNDPAMDFWERVGFQRRDDIHIYSATI